MSQKECDDFEDYKDLSLSLAELPTRPKKWKSDISKSDSDLVLPEENDKLGEVAKQFSSCQDRVHLVKLPARSTKFPRETQSEMVHHRRGTPDSELIAIWKKLKPLHMRSESEPEDGKVKKRKSRSQSCFDSIIDDPEKEIKSQKAQVKRSLRASKQSKLSENILKVARKIVDRPSINENILWIVIEYRHFDIVSEGNGKPSSVSFSLNQEKESTSFLFLRRKRSVRVSRLAPVNSFSKKLLSKREDYLWHKLSVPIEDVCVTWTRRSLLKALEDARKKTPSAWSNCSSLVHAAEKKQKRRPTRYSIRMEDRVVRGVLDELQSETSPIDWVIFNFPMKEATRRSNIDVTVEVSGSGGSKVLREKLSAKNVQFAILKFVTHIDKRMSKGNMYKYVCIIWVPPEHGSFTVDEIRRMTLKYEVIKRFKNHLPGVETMTAEGRGMINRNSILSFLNQKGCLRELLIRVVTNKDDSRTQLIYIDRHLDLGTLKERLAEEVLGLNLDMIDMIDKRNIVIEIINDITIYEESYFQNVPRTYSDPPNITKDLTDEDDSKTLLEVGITFGCKIYVEYEDAEESDSEDSSSEWMVRQQTLATRGQREMDDLIGITAGNVSMDDIFWLRKDIARGRSASVHQALLWETIPVAVKEFRFGRLTEKIKNDFESEVALFHKLSHKNVVKMLALMRDYQQRRLYIILEWVGQGALVNFIRGVAKYNFKHVLMMAEEIAEGMRYLHSRKLIHRDLKSHNLLLNDQHHIKVTDFGTSKIIDEANSTFTEVGTLGYTAPEIFGFCGYGIKVDVFSYAIILWELIDRGKNKNPLVGIFSNYYEKVQSGIRPKFSKKVHRLFPEYIRLVEDCWSFDPEERPEFDEVCKRLKDISDKYIGLHKEDINKDMDDEEQKLDIDGIGDMPSPFANLPSPVRVCAPLPSDVPKPGGVPVPVRVPVAKKK